MVSKWGLFKYVFLGAHPSVMDDGPATATSTHHEPDQIPLDVLRQRLAQEQAERPVMPVPEEGKIAVAIQKTDNFVLVYIQLSETTKHVLSNSRILQTPVDEFYLDMSDRLHETFRDIDDLPSELVSYREKQDEKRERIKQFTAPHYITLDNFLANPFRHPVSNPREALEYIEKLKTKILPKVKALIESASGPQSESFQL